MQHLLPNNKSKRLLFDLDHIPQDDDNRSPVRYSPPDTGPGNAIDGAQIPGFTRQRAAAHRTRLLFISANKVSE